MSATAQAASTTDPAARGRIRNFPIRINRVMHYVPGQPVDSGTPSSDSSLDACRVNGHSSAVVPSASFPLSPTSARPLCLWRQDKHNLLIPRWCPGTESNVRIVRNVKTSLITETKNPALDRGLVRRVALLHNHSAFINETGFLT